MDEQMMTVDQLSKKLKSNAIVGLTNEEAQERFQNTGPNEFPFLRQPGPMRIIIKCLFGGYQFFIWNNLVFCFLLYVVERYNKSYVEVSVIYLSITLAVAILLGSLKHLIHLTGSGREKFPAWSELRRLCHKKVKVIRNNTDILVNINNIVVGDLVKLESGSLVPADLRVVDSNKLTINTFFLTGHSKNLPKTTGICQNENILEAANLALFSGVVMHGYGRGLVINSGSETVMQALANNMINGGGKLQMKLEARNVKQMLKIFGFLGGVFCYVFFPAMGKTGIESALFFCGFNIASVCIYKQLQDYLDQLVAVN